MIMFFLGSIPLGTNTLTGPTGRSVTRQNTFAQYDVTRGKPTLHEIGEELDTQRFDFFFSEEFCNPAEELSKLELAFAMKSPLPLMIASGQFLGKRFVVDTLEKNVVKTNRSGGITRVEATIALLEAPVPSLLGLVTNMAKALAPATSSAAVSNPNVKRYD